MVDKKMPDNNIKRWNRIINDEKIMKDPLLYSIFKQARFLEYEGNERVVRVELKNKIPFILDKINENRDLWLPIFKRQFIYANDVKFFSVREYQELQARDIRNLTGRKERSHIIPKLVPLKIIPTPVPMKSLPKMEPKKAELSPVTKAQKAYMARSKLKRLIADIPIDIHNKTRMLGIKRNCPMSTIIVRALMAYIKFEEKSE